MEIVMRELSDLRAFYLKIQRAKRERGTTDVVEEPQASYGKTKKNSEGGIP